MSEQTLGASLNDMAESLHQLQVLKDFVGLLIYTGQLADERPVSAVIVAPAGAGKTTTLESLACDQAQFVSDITARTLEPLVKNDKLTHILLGDMLAMLNHKSSTVKLTMQLVARFTGETLNQNPWTGEAIQPKKLGLITAITPDVYGKQKKHLIEGGFASRFLIIRYTYKPSTIAAIHRFISGNRYSNVSSNNSFHVEKPGQYKVIIPDKLAEKVKDFGLQIRKDDLGFRAHRHIRSLVKAVARRDNRNECKETDLGLIQNYCEFFSSDGKAI